MSAFNGAGAGPSTSRVRPCSSSSSSSFAFMASGRDLTLKYLPKGTQRGMTFAQIQPLGQTPWLPPGGHSPLQEPLAVLLHLQLLVPEWGWEAQRPILHLTANSAHLHVHVQWAGITAGGVGLRARKEEGQRFSRYLNITF